jgi:colanic acid/amylovoran biosynthesis glycosyltransferase
MDLSALAALRAARVADRIQVTVMSAAPRPPLRVAYLVNQYPKVSHSFIRREILALERQGVELHRFAVRGWDAETPDRADAQERERTRYLLREGSGALLLPTLRALVRNPRRFFAALALALRLARGADRALPYHLVYLAEACRLGEWLDGARAVHLHAHFGTNAAEVALLAHALGGPPFSFTVHGPEEFDRPVALHLGAKAHAAAFVVAVSSYGRSQLYRWVACADWPRIEVVHCGLDRSFDAEPPVAVPAVARLVSVGRLCEQKGQLLLLDALQRLVADRVDIELVLAGDGEMRQDIEAKIDSLGLRSRVRITGWIGAEQVRDEMLAARALVLPSFAEGLPVVVMEAMALGRPVITTYVAGIPELVRDGQTGWLVAAGDVAGLAEAMKDCLSSPLARLQAMATAARAIVRERHDVDREAAKLRALFARSDPSPSVRDGLAP